MTLHDRRAKKRTKSLVFNPLTYTERFHFAVKARGFGVCAFCKAAELDRRTYYTERNGYVRMPNADTLVRIAKTLNVSVDWLLGLTETGGPAPVETEACAPTEASACDGSALGT